MIRFVPSSIGGAVLGAILALLPLSARAQMEQQSLVDRATLTVQDLMSKSTANDPASLLRRAKGVMICPQVLRIAFIFGGSGSDCVLVGRDAAGGWSYPAFYGMGSGSAGAQIGIQDSAMMMMILTDKGMSAVMDSQFKFGADASIAFVSLGAGVEGSTTAALGADIVVAAETRGLFAGVSLQGSLMKSRTDYNRAYYGQPLAARQITMLMQARNPGADPLREMLTRYGTSGPAVAVQAPPPGQYAPQQQQPMQLAPPPAAQPLAPVQSQPLPPPRS